MDDGDNTKKAARHKAGPLILCAHEGALYLRDQTPRIGGTTSDSTMRKPPKIGAPPNRMK
jgi:hypothetical protein